MIILAIETSCDETATAVVENGTKILSNVVASSVEIHAKTGGIIPEVAAREQLKYIIPVIEEALRTGCGWDVRRELGNGGEKWVKKSSSPHLISRPTSHFPSPPIDCVAVTHGPGLIGSLLVGVETARTLAYAWNKPLIPVNHLVAHIYANWLISEHSENSESQQVRKSDNLKIRHSGIQSVPSFPKKEPPQFPTLALIVSGGHTDLVLMKDHEQIEWIGGTRDDAAGECFDKCARLLGLGYPGGPAIAVAAAKFETGNSKLEIKLPRPMLHEDNFDFSFSGLKTAVLRETYKLRINHQSSIINHQLAYEIQEAICDVLVTKTMKAAEKFKVKSILLAGGVAANSRLREKFKIEMENGKCLTERDPASREKMVNLFIPPPKLCTDNAAIVASAAYFNNHPLPWQEVTTEPGLPVVGEV
ncbi:MAG: tRNA (adenosine(37)-N6)-threonylcarbamoyltransferase complex transferase subunit TsaD [bacterium]|nr:tRNA (adenosine(37)-N6)-threonylcarbamoyltransferase complex transferase subunit TsaD [bacterium]